MSREKRRSFKPAQVPKIEIIDDYLIVVRHSIVRPGDLNVRPHRFFPSASIQLPVPVPGYGQGSTNAYANLLLTHSVRCLFSLEVEQNLT